MHLDPELYARVEARLKGSGFSTVEEFVSFVLARLLEEGAQTGEPFSQADEARVKEHLRSLGYLD